jgi:hypothetical protein
LFRPVAPWTLALPAVLGGVLLVLRMPWAVRLAGLLLLWPALLYTPPRPAQGEFELIALDVGQGTSVLLRTHAHLRADAVEPADQLEVKFGVAAEVVVDATAALEQARQDLVEIVDGVGIVHAVMLDRAFRPGARAVPAFPLGVALAAEQQGLAMRRPGTSTSTASGSGKPAR